MEEAIKKAIEGGYTTFSWEDVQGGDGANVLLDKDFWQALIMQIDVEKYHTGDPITKEIYLPVWHSFLDHIAEGKLPEDFFNELLK